MGKESLFTQEEKKVIGETLLKMLTNSGMSAPKFAVSIGFTKSDISNLKTKAWVAKPQLIGDQKWLRLAQKARFAKSVELSLRTAHTDVYEFITAQLSICQRASTYSLLCDSAGVGKTYACVEYRDNNANVLYVDCSKSPRTNQFKRAFATAAGIVAVGRIDDYFEAAIIAVQQMQRPLLILDEAGDLKDEVFKLIKRLYNDLEDICGIYMLGAGGLKAKIEAGMGCNKVGFEEVFSRFGMDYSRRTPDPRNGKLAFEAFMKNEMTAILLENGFDRQQSDRMAETMKSRDLRAIKRAIKATRLELQ